MESRAHRRWLLHLFVQRGSHLFFSLPASKVNSRTSTLERGEKRGIWEFSHIRLASYTPGLVCRKPGEKRFALEDMREEFCTECKCNFKHLNETRLFTHYVEKLWSTAKRTTFLKEKEGCVFHENPEMGKHICLLWKLWTSWANLGQKVGPPRGESPRLWSYQMLRNCLLVTAQTRGVSSLDLSGAVIAAT